jgi:parallel beta-helix repeat protein
VEDDVRKRLVGGLAILVTVAAALVVSGGPAFAVTPSQLFVNNTAGANCSDSGTGTQSQPYCTISAALAVVQPGQTVDVTGTYNEQVTIDKSGTPGQPIVLRHQTPGVAVLRGAVAGITVDGQHDVSISGFSIAGTPSPSLVSLSNSTRLALDNVLAFPTTAAIGIKLAAVTDSSLTRANIHGPSIAGLLLDGATSRVVVKSSLVAGSKGKGIDVLGSNNTIVGNSVQGAGDAGIAIESGAAGTVVANNSVFEDLASGIYNIGATGTAIANNFVQDSCATGIRVDGASSGVSVQNNVGVNNGYTRCTPVVADAVEIGVYGNAVNGTVVDYNTVTHDAGAQSEYAWSTGTPMGLAAFRTASGQAQHDIESGLQSANLDSANSAAPGFQSTDVNGNPREDDPGMPNTGAGPINYADRGPREEIRGPTAAVSLSADLFAVTITADASGSTPGFVPIASYTFDFGDGTTVTQSTPVATHHYPVWGEYVVSVKATDVNGFSSTASGVQSVYHATGTIALLSRSDDRYVTAESAGTQPLIASRGVIGHWELFDLIDFGNGLVALHAHANGRYVTVGPAGSLLTATGTRIGNDQTFQLSTNLDGTISLRSQSAGKFVSAEAAGSQPLVANRAGVGLWEEFNVVNAGNSAVSLRAGANGRYVTADAAGGRPLIANRTAVGLWERFDVVDAGGGYVALYSHADGRFVCADNGGALPLIANRTGIGRWEKFKIINNPDGSISLQAAANGRYVTAEAAGNQPLIANRTAIGAWEKFSRSST